MSKRLRRLSTLLPVVLVAALGGTAAIAGTTADTLLSQGKPVLASSIEDNTFTADKAVDGSTTTRWASMEGHDPEWIRVDLGQTADIHRVKLLWEAAYAKSYRIEVSNDGTTFTTVKSLTSQNGGTDDNTGLTGHGRYVRIVGTARGTAYGYSLFELQVYGVGDSTGDTQAPTVPTGLASTGVSASTVSLSWTASTDNVGVAGYDVLRNGAVVATSTSTTYTDTGLAADTTYTYSVRARDLAGNVSGASTAITAKTSAGGTGGFVLAAAGDIARQCTASSSSCIHPKTAQPGHGDQPGQRHHDGRQPVRRRPPVGLQQLLREDLGEVQSHHQAGPRQPRDVRRPAVRRVRLVLRFGDREARRASATTAGRRATGTSSPSTPPTS